MGSIQSIILGFCQNIDNVSVTYWFLFEMIRKDVTILEMIKTIVFIKFSRIKSKLIWKCGLVLKSNSKCYEEWLNSHYLNKDIFPFLIIW